MADELKNTDSANLFVIFGEPDIESVEARIADPHPSPLPDGEGTERSPSRPEADGVLPDLAKWVYALGGADVGSVPVGSLA